jgi:hypothetical protein
VLAVALLLACETRTPAPHGSTLSALRVPVAARGVSPLRALLVQRCPPPPPGVTLAGLLIEMVDLTHLAQLPDVPYASRLASSHDRASDGAAPDSEQWFANHDFIALAADEPVTLLDVQGPGVLTRLWSASPGGVLRIYLDGASTPVIEADLRALLRGEAAFSAPFAFVAAGGHNLYFPIPFARGCRVTLTGEDPNVYYQLAYRRYPAGAQVESYGREALARAECVRGEVARRLEDPAAEATASQRDERHGGRLDTEQPSRPLVIAAARSGSLLRELRIRPERLDDASLRSTVLTIEFDGVTTVRAPLGDFFGRGPGAHEVASLPTTAARDGTLTARWPMPFARQARIALAATGLHPNAATVEATSSPWPFEARSLYFHAHFRPPETFASKPSRDLPLLAIEGRGHYVGNVLNVVNRNAAWWGEGDEKVWVDGEVQPSHFGTGTEDYYGYAYCANERFSRAYIGMPATSERESFGRISLHRFHVLDPIPFARALRFDLEVRHWGEPVQVTYDALGLFYARPAARAPAPAHDAFRVPELGVPVPDVPAGPYRCGR